jgi:small subunit ribosomal protein S21
MLLLVTLLLHYYYFLMENYMSTHFFYDDLLSIRIDSALRRFKREVNKSGHLIELRHKRFHESSQEKVKRKAAQARIRKRFERMQKRRLQQQNRV